jgi:hypothetical protein
MSDDDPEVIATFEAAFLPNWTWEVFEVEEREAELVTDVDENNEVETAISDVYRGRVQSPNTRGGWDYGTFSTHDLRQAGAFRTDEDTDEWP